MIPNFSVHLLKFSTNSLSFLLLNHLSNTSIPCKIKSVSITFRTIRLV